MNPTAIGASPNGWAGSGGRVRMCRFPCSSTGCTGTSTRWGRVRRRWWPTTGTPPIRTPVRSCSPTTVGPSTTTGTPRSWSIHWARMDPCGGIRSTAGPPIRRRACSSTTARRCSTSTYRQTSPHRRISRNRSRSTRMDRLRTRHQVASYLAEIFPDRQFRIHRARHGWVSPADSALGAGDRPGELRGELPDGRGDRASEPAAAW